MMTGTTKDDVQSRLKRIAGQVSGIQRMVDEGRYCVDILVQIAAVRSALGKVAQKCFGSHVDTCVANALEHGTAKERRETLDELFDVLARFGKL